MRHSFQIKKLFYSLLLAYILNVIWENAHSVLYVNYQGGPIFEWILLRAAFVDAVIITSIIFIFNQIVSARIRPWAIAIANFLIAIEIEWWGLGSSRWTYAEAMPQLPFLHVGLTPILQLPFLGVLVYFIVSYSTWE